MYVLFGSLFDFRSTCLLIHLLGLVTCAGDSDSQYDHFIADDVVGLGRGKQFAHDLTDS